MRTKLSIIIVNYHVHDYLASCISSIYSSKTKNFLEIIIVDNDEKKTISTDLKRRFPKIKYISNKNKGFGQGNNVGALNAKGEYLFFLNPDTLVKPGAIDNLINFLEKDKSVGVVAPLLLDANGKPYVLQGTEELTPLKSIFTYSLIDKIFPDNPISRKFWKRGWDKTKIKQVDVIPGTAFMISSELFKRVGRFDERIFLYFEEYDLCKRVGDLGFKIYIEPKSKVVHFWGESTKKSQRDINEIFNESRFYYFKKHFGIMPALFSSIFLSLNKSNLPILTTVLIGIFLRVYKLSDSMTMISDQGWFYLSARDLIVNHQIPLVGITSSHTWLHQGPVWTYMLALVLWIGKFNPLAGGYLSVGIDTLTIIVVYEIVKSMFSKKAGVISALLYATSPLVILYARMPYHTSPIPLLSILFLFTLYKWVKGNVVYFPLSLLICALLYNFELANILFAIILMFFLFYGILKKEKWAQIFTTKILGLSIVLPFIPMIPIIIYDFGHGFPQTIKFAAWTVLQALAIVGIKIRSSGPHESWSSVTSYFFDAYGKIILPTNILLASAVFLLVVLLNVILIWKLYKENLLKINYLCFYTCSVILILGFFSQRARSGAYLPMIFPYLIILVALGLVYIEKYRKIVYLLVITISVFNVYNILSNNYWATGSTLKPLIYESKFIVANANGREFYLSKENFKSNIDINQYRYLTLWLGGRISTNSSLVYGIYNNVEGIPKNRIFQDDFISITRIKNND